jgi:hypothetical protein
MNPAAGASFSLALYEKHHVRKTRIFGAFMKNAKGSVEFLAFRKKKPPSNDV